MNKLGFLACAAVCLVALNQPALASGSHSGGGHSGGSHSGAGHFSGGHFSGGHFSGGHFGGGIGFSHPPARIVVPQHPHFVARPFIGSRARVIIAAPFVAAPLFYYPPPAYYPPPVYYTPTPGVMVPPSQYIEQEPSPDASTRQYWYYCADSNAYYPYVKECPGGWETVTPQPPPS